MAGSEVAIGLRIGIDTYVLLRVRLEGGLGIRQGQARFHVQVP